MTERHRYGFDDKPLPWEPGPPEEPDPLPVKRLHEIVWDGERPYDPQHFWFDDELCQGWYDERHAQWARLHDLERRGTAVFTVRVLPFPGAFAYTLVAQEKQRVARRIDELTKLVDMCTNAYWDEMDEEYDYEEPELEYLKMQQEEQWWTKKP